MNGKLLFISTGIFCLNCCPFAIARLSSELPNDLQLGRSRVTSPSQERWEKPQHLDSFLNLESRNHQGDRDKAGLFLKSGLPKRKSAIVTGQHRGELPLSLQTPANFPPPNDLETPTNELETLPETLSPSLDPIFPSQPQLPAVPAPDPLDVTIRVEQIQIVGSTAFTAEELQGAVRSFIGKDVTYEELLAIRTQITQLYRDRGYTTSGAFLPPQDLTDGSLTIQVVEGVLERLDIQGLERLQPGYIRSRIGRAATPPLNLHRLEEALHLLRLNPLFDRVQAELSAGTAPGLSVLTLTIQEASALTLGVAGENYDSPSVGSMSGRIYASHRNFSGLGDRFTAEVRDTRGLTQYSIGYEVPLNPRDGTLSLRLTSGGSRIIETPFEPLGIRSQSSTISLGFRQPLILTPTTEFAAAIFLDLRESETFLFDTIPFSFSPGPERGKSQVTALRFSQDWVNRSNNRVLAARSQFNLGLPLFNATLNDRGVDAEFFSWNGQFQWVEAFSPDTILVARLGAQIAFDSLLPLEQFSLGGLDTVRGYRRNQRVADSGIVGSLELRLTVLRDPGGWGILEVSPFFDFGTVWNRDGTLTPISGPTTLASVGLGARWQLNRTLSARFDWGIPLVPLESQGHTLQDRGLVFSIRFQPFD